MATFERNDRLNELFIKEISKLLVTVKDPGMAGLLTVTGLDLARDRKTAKIFFSVIGSEEDRSSTERALNRAAEYLRQQMKGRLKLRIIPKLSFHYDPTPERAHRIEQIFDQIRAQDEQPPK